jgi:serine/threonine protein kinase
MWSETSSGSGGSDAFAPVAQTHFSGPATIQGFRVLSSVPEPGAQADLYLAEGEESRCYAIKIYRRSIVRSEGAARVLAELKSDRLLVPHYQGEWEGRAMEVMPYLPEGSLADLIKRDGPLSTEQTLRLVNQVTEGLEQLHRSGIQHRDLKPTNILVRSREPLELVLADFGSATIADATVLSQPHGTLFYSAPETLTGMYSRAGDYWSLGVVLIEALTGDSIAATLRNDALLPYRIVQGKVPIPQSIPKGWRPLLKGLLERDHYRRWQAAEIRIWLDRKSRTIKVVAEKKPRPWLIAGLTLTLALAIGAGLYLDRLFPGKSGTSDSAGVGRTSSQSLIVAPAEHGSLPRSTASGSHVERDLRSASANLSDFMIMTVEALAWILAGIFLMTGLAHLFGGTPHGSIAILFGLLLAIGAYFLPRLWS